MDLDPEEQRQVQRLQIEAAEAAAARLRSLFERASVQFGALALVRRLGELPVDPTGALALAKAITALDYFTAWARPPRPAVGGLTNPINRRRWTRLRGHLVARLLTALSQEASGSLLWRSVLGRIPEVWLPVPLLQRSIAAGLADIPPYASITVELDIANDRPGGRTWLAAQTRQALEGIDAALDDGRPSLVELIRAVETAPTAAELVVVYAMERRSGDRLRLLCYDPETGGGKVLCCEEEDGGLQHFAEVPDTGERAAIKALRVWEVAPVSPPFFGIRGLLPWLLPWRLLWWIRRWFSLRFGAGRDAALRAP